MKTPEQIVQRVSEATQVPLSILKDTRRFSRHIVRARRIAVLVISKRFCMPLSGAGSYAGYSGKNVPADVIKGLESEIETNPNVAKFVQRVIDYVQEGTD